MLLHLSSPSESNCAEIENVEVSEWLNEVVLTKKKVDSNENESQNKTQRNNSCELLSL